MRKLFAGLLYRIENSIKLIVRSATKSIVIFLSGIITAQIILLTQSWPAISIILLLVILAVSVLLFALLFIKRFRPLWKYLVYASVFIFGVNFLFFSKFCLNNPTFSNDLLKKNTSIIVTGAVAREPLLFDDKAIIVFKPYSIADASAPSNKIFVRRFYHGYIAVALPVSEIENISYPNDLLAFRGKIRLLRESERKYGMQTGIPYNVVWIADNIDNIEKIPYYSRSWINQGLRMIKDVALSSAEEMIPKQGAGLLYWLFFNEQSSIPMFLRGEHQPNRILYLVVKSKFYLITILLVFLIIGGSLGWKRRLAYIIALPLILFYGLLNGFSVEVIRTVLLFAGFIFLATHYSWEKSLYYALTWGVFILSIFDPFIFTDKWFVYLLLLLLATVYGTKRMEALLERFFSGWLIWFSFCVGLFLCVLGIFPYILQYYSLRAALVILVFLTFIAAILLQKLLPWKGLEFKDFNFIFKKYISWILSAYVCVFIPASIFFVDPLSLSDIFLGIFILAFLVIFMQLGFTGIVTAMFLSSINWISYSAAYVVWYYEFTSRLSRIFTQFLFFTYTNFSGEFIFRIKNSLTVVFAYFLIVVAGYYIVTNYGKIRSNFSRIKGYAAKHSPKKIVFLAVVLAGCVFIVFNGKSTSLTISSNDIFRCVLVETPIGKKIVVFDVINKDESSLNLILNRGWGNIDYCLKHGLQSPDIIIIRNAQNSFRIVREIGNIARSLSCKMIAADLGLYTIQSDFTFSALQEQNRYSLSGDDYSNIMQFLNENNYNVTGKKYSLIQELNQALKQLSPSLYYFPVIGEERIYEEENGGLFMLGIIDMGDEKKSAWVLRIINDDTFVYYGADDITEYPGSEDTENKSGWSRINLVDKVSHADTTMLIYAPILRKGLFGKGLVRNNEYEIGTANNTRFKAVIKKDKMRVFGRELLNEGK
ncbi:MAG: DUF4131 domain-containing protein [Elusimicrobiota bacterium]